ncbi:MAG TPA: helix-turn-helix domain-containing protein [Lamprocystis sp. (in: g-proteobacteria)]|nr:helix-turn-helix domain-containing protein [Lamprocystis sp. (in: g-proteobacteria)]
MPISSAVLRFAPHERHASVQAAPKGRLPASLADTLRQVVSFNTVAAVGLGRGALSIKGHGIGRVEIVEAAGACLTIDTEGAASAATAQVSAMILVEGTAEIRQGERSAQLAAGDLCLIRSGRPLQLKFTGSFRITLVGAPEEELADRFPLWRAALLTPIRAESGVPAVFRDASVSLQRWQDSLGVAGRDGLADAVMDLMGALVCFAVPSHSDCVQQSLYQRDRIKTVAQRNLRNPELDIDFIAAAVGLSARQVHRLFADEGTSLMRWVWVQRLEQCHRELAQDDSGRRSISDIAYTWGFNDQAHFSRAFRKHFGLAPRDLRRSKNRLEGDLSSSDVRIRLSD